MVERIGVDVRGKFRNSGKWWVKILIERVVSEDVTDMCRCIIVKDGDNGDMK